MIDIDQLKKIPKGQPLAIFGDTNFPVGRIGYPKKIRKEFARRFKGFLSILRPSHVWIIPNTGTNSVVLTLLRAVNIPYTIVLPYHGYCDNMLESSKLQVYFAMREKTRSHVVTIGEEANNLFEQKQLVEEAEDFILDRAPITACLHGDNITPYMKRLITSLPGRAGGTLIMVNYNSDRKG
jgi:hypothetical protein